MQHELPPASQRLGVQTVEISFKSAAAAAAVGAARHAPRDWRGQTACDPLALFVAWYGSARALRPELHAARRHATAREACPAGDKTVSKSNCLKVESRGSNKNGSLNQVFKSGTGAAVKTVRLRQVVAVHLIINSYYYVLIYIILIKFVSIYGHCNFQA